MKGPNGKVRTYQQMTAKGPGVVHMFDKNTKKSVDHASWTETLVSSRDADTKAWCRDGPLDLLVLTGSARFWNDEQGSSLQGDTLKVWVMPREPEGDPAAKSQPANQAGPKPKRVDAIGHVFSNSRELVIYDTSRLKVVFKDAPPVTLPPVLPGPAAPTERTPPAGPVALRTTAPAVHEAAKPSDTVQALPTGPALAPVAPSPDPVAAPTTTAKVPEPEKSKTEPTKTQEAPPRPMYLTPGRSTPRCCAARTGHPATRRTPLTPTPRARPRGASSPT